MLKAEKVGPRQREIHLPQRRQPRAAARSSARCRCCPRPIGAKRDFDKTTLDPPLGSGPYKIDTFDAGRGITYRRVADYWGKDLPVNRGRNNFDIIRYDYYRDQGVALEAFKAGAYDIRVENVSKNWAIGYDGPALTAGLYQEGGNPEQGAARHAGLRLQHRARPIFQDPRVRQALGYLFDFEWTNKALFYGAYTRTKSYFSNSDLASSGLPGPDELQDPGQIPRPDSRRGLHRGLCAAQDRRLGQHPRQSARGARAPGPGRLDRQGRAAGQRQGRSRSASNSCSTSRNSSASSCLSRRTWRALGITTNVRTIDPAQYENRMQNFDFDMTVVLFPESLSPGNEQRDYWTGRSGRAGGRRNLLGIKSQAVDDLVDLVDRRARPARAW